MIASSQLITITGRGNSKYHYYGIRIKPDSPLNTFPQDEIVAIRSAPNQQRRYVFTSHNCSVSGCGRDEMKEEGGGDHDLMASGSGHSAASTMQQQHQQYLGDVDVVLQNFPEIEWGSTPVPGTVYSVHLLKVYFMTASLYNLFATYLHEMEI